MNRPEQRANDARINAELAGEELKALEFRTAAIKREKLEEIQKLEEQLEAARAHKATLDAEAKALATEWQATKETNQ